MTVSLETLADPVRLIRAFEAVRERRDCPGVDRVSVEEFGEQLPQHVQRLAEELAAGTYRSLPVLRIEVPDGAKTRPLAIPTVRDRTVQRALADLLQTSLEPALSPAAYAFRPDRGAHRAVQDLLARMSESRAMVLKGDIRRFFERTDQGLMLGTLGMESRDMALRLAALLKHSYGRRSENVDPNQLTLLLQQANAPLVLP